ncbi:PilZ domain-containing protein [Hoeflea ulvae]|uniref:PilZ domain-containing protein n=1 Tax=Hoeflea ulvae TaxID=2983764 RepID=A0ABT3YEL2_9HYPH|nr:PilZ domain-containing protein [Hoeflea ulvae]MCY0094318.1 PilZ domain-containing protein [Hoeflea ulvae]
MTEQTASSGPDSALVVRQALRKRVFKGALACLDGGLRAMPCTIRDLSETGARLRFGCDWLVPEHFTLHVEIDGYKLQCERVWYRNGDCGVRFVGERISTGQPRQQIILPVLSSEDRAASEIPSAPCQSVTMPAPRRVAARSTGFGRRTR